jgi:hypothetical protein
VIRNERCAISEFHIVKTRIKDQSVLVQTLKEMGYTPVIHKEAKQLEGYQGDKRSQKAHIILPRKQVGSASNDVGFEKTKEGFILHASAYDAPWRTGKKVKQLNKGYAENKLKKVVNKTSSCSILSRKENKKGQIEIQIRIS